MRLDALFAENVLPSVLFAKDEFGMQSDLL